MFYFVFLCGKSQPLCIQDQRSAKSSTPIDRGKVTVSEVPRPLGTVWASLNRPWDPNARLQSFDAFSRQTSSLPYCEASRKCASLIPVFSAAGSACGNENRVGQCCFPHLLLGSPSQPQPEPGWPERSDTWLASRRSSVALSRARSTLSGPTMNSRGNG